MRLKFLLLSVLFFLSQTLLAVNTYSIVLKSFNFKFYYTNGGEDKAKLLITEAEKSLESMENFLGTRLIEQIDVFLSEEAASFEMGTVQRNGSIVINNSSIYLNYSGNTKLLLATLKNSIAEILINGMLYGNTIKERLKNNREINVPDWYVIGLAKYVSEGKSVNTSWLADYYEGKLTLNLNLSSKNELAFFGQAVFSYINDSFGLSKLKQLLFYTKLSGKTDYAFQFVLNKSLNWVIADWYKMEKNKYLLESNERLPNEPEILAEKLKVSDLIEIKMNQNGTEIDLLVKSDYGIEIWNYNLQSKVSKRLYKKNDIGVNNKWSFAKNEKIYYLTKSNGLKSTLYLYKDKKQIKAVSLDFNFILSIKSFGESLYILAQKNYKVDIFKLSLIEDIQIQNLTNSVEEETDLVIDSVGNLYYTVFDNNKYKLKSGNTNKQLFSSNSLISSLNLYINNFLSILKTENGKQVGVIVNVLDSNQVYQITNYNRSIKFSDFNVQTQKVLEVLSYKNQNYLVISEASFEKVSQKPKIKVVDTSVFLIIDTTIGIYPYKFITGFEYNRRQTNPKNPNPILELNLQTRIKEITVYKNEFKAQTLMLNFSNSQFNSPYFASFFPKNAGIYNGPNIMVGTELMDISKRFILTGNLRQPLLGKGTDFDLGFYTNTLQNSNKFTFGVFMFSNNYQRELYNTGKRFATNEIKLYLIKKIHPRIKFHSELGYRADVLIPLAVSYDNLVLKKQSLKQLFYHGLFEFLLFNKTRLNYSHKLTSNVSFLTYKPFNKNGFNTNLTLKLKYKQSIFRIFHLSSSFVLQSSVAKQKTIWLMGGVSNWLQPIYGNAYVYNEANINLYSVTDDFEGLPFNYKAGSSVSMFKFRISVPLNPIVSQQNFNQNFFKFMSLHAYSNAGISWFGGNPFSIKNPDNKETIETGSITITNYIAKNPLIWSFGSGISTVLLGYEIGFDYAIGYRDTGKIGKFTYFTVGKSF